MAKILILDDKPTHLQAGCDAAAARGMTLVRGCTFGDARDILMKDRNRATIDGVITDVFMPLSHAAPWNHSDQPVGLLVAAMAAQFKIPCVLCTAGYHHGSHYEWIHVMRDFVDWIHMIDSGTSEGESETKDWDSALNWLDELMT